MLKATVSHKGCGFLFFMRLKINGETVGNLKAVTVRELLEELKIESGRVAVEVNLAVIRKQDFETFRLNDGDAVEIVNFVGGG
jgi:sulfur carrier protein